MSVLVQPVEFKILDCLQFLSEDGLNACGLAVFPGGACQGFEDDALVEAFLHWIEFTIDA